MSATIRYLGNYGLALVSLKKYGSAESHALKKINLHKISLIFNHTVIGK